MITNKLIHYNLISVISHKFRIHFHYYEKGTNNQYFQLVITKTLFVRNRYKFAPTHFAQSVYTARHCVEIKRNRAGLRLVQVPPRIVYSKGAARQRRPFRNREPANLVLSTLTVRSALAESVLIRNLPVFRRSQTREMRRGQVWVGRACSGDDARKFAYT